MCGFVNFILKGCHGGFGEMLQDEKMVSRKFHIFGFWVEFSPATERTPSKIRYSKSCFNTFQSTLQKL